MPFHRNTSAHSTLRVVALLVLLSVLLGHSCVDPPWRGYLGASTPATR